MGQQILDLTQELKIILIDDEIDVFLQNAAKRAVKTALFTYKALQQQQEQITLGHPFDYFTYKDQGRVEYLLDRIKDGKIESLSELELYVKRLDKISHKRLPNLFYLFSIYPKLVFKIVNSLFFLIEN